MNLVFRCMFRWVVGMVMGLTPALVYYLYAQSTEVIRDEAYYTRLTLVVEVGCVAGAIGGLIWASKLAIAAYKKSRGR